MKTSNFIPFNRAAAMQMVTRRMPGVHRKGFAAYKTDGGAVTLEELGAQVKEFNEQHKKVLKDYEASQAEVIRITKEYNDKVGDLNKTLGEKDATIKQIQGEVVELNAKMGRMQLGVQGDAPKSVQSLISKSFKDNAQAIAKASAANPVSLITDPVEVQTQWRAKAAGTITLAANVTGTYTNVGVPTISPEIATRGYDETHFRDIFPIFDSATGSYVFYRSKTPTGDGSITKQTAGQAKSQKDYDLEIVNVSADYLAGYADVAKQALTDIPMLQSFLTNELIEDYLDTETYNMWQELLAAVTGPTPSTGSNTIEKMIYTIAAIRQIKRRVNFMVVRPQMWASIMVTKPNDYSIPNSVIITPQGTVAIVGLPMYVTSTNALSDSKFVMGDSRQAGIMQVTGEGLKLELFQQHDKAVYNNILTWRVEARVAMLLRRLEAFSYNNG